MEHGNVCRDLGNDFGHSNDFQPRVTFLVPVRTRPVGIGAWSGRVLGRMDRNPADPFHNAPHFIE